MTNSLIGRALIGMRLSISTIDSVIIVGTDRSSRDIFRLYTEPIELIDVDGNHRIKSKFIHTTNSLTSDAPDKAYYILIYTSALDRALVTDAYAVNTTNKVLNDYGEGMPLQFIFKAEWILDTVIPFKDLDLNYSVEVTECKKINLK